MLKRTDNLVRRGMTLVELLVAVAILVIMIAGVGYIFSNTSTAVRHTQAVIDTNAAVRVAAGRLREDLESMTPDGFLCLIGAGEGGSGEPATRPLLMFTVSGRFTAPVQRVGGDHPTANAAIVAYTLARDPETDADALMRYVFLLTGDNNVRDETIRDLLGASPSPAQFQQRIREYQCLSASLADVRRLIMESTPTNDLFFEEYIEPLRNPVAAYDSNPMSVDAIRGLWPYLVGGCDGVDLAFYDGYRVDYGNAVTYPGEPTRWIRMVNDDADGMVDRDGDGQWDTVRRDPDEAPVLVDDVEPYHSDGNELADSLEARTSRGPYPEDSNVMGIYRATPANDPAPMIIWCHRVKAEWPKALRLRLHLRDVAEHLDEPREYEIVVPLPTKG